MRYYVRARFRESGKEFVTSFDSIVARTMYIITIGNYANVEEEWSE